ncbi:PREDICTED: transposon CACTA, partial [Prunus dulcis]
MGKVGKQYASYIGVMARAIIPIHISSWVAVDDHLKEKIWTEITSVFELTLEKKQSTLQSASTKWRQFKSTLTREYVLPHRNDPEALKEPPEMYDFIELSDWQSFVISRLSENWQEIHELQKESRSKCKYHHRTGRKGYIVVVEELVDKKIVAKDEEVDQALLWKEKLLKEKEEGLITISGYNDVLAMALGTPEHGGRVRGVGGYVKPNAFFNVPRKKRECVSKEMVKERDVFLQETKKMMEEQQKKHEAVQELLQKQIEMLKVAISGQTFAVGKEVCEDGCEDVVEQIEVQANKGKDCKLAFGSKDNIVASGTIFDINVPQQLLPNVPLGEGNVRVSVNYALNGASPLPILVKGVLNTVEDVVGSQVAWLEYLIVFIDDIV